MRFNMRTQQRTPEWLLPLLKRITLTKTLDSHPLIEYSSRSDWVYSRACPSNNVCRRRRRKNLKKIIRNHIKNSSLKLPCNDREKINLHSSLIIHFFLASLSPELYLFCYSKLLLSSAPSVINPKWAVWLFETCQFFCDPWEEIFLGPIISSCSARSHRSPK